MDPTSLQPEASNLAGTAPASPQVEASALPRTPQTPLQLVARKFPLNLNRLLSQFKEPGMR
jgi:hypothetical protein